VILGEYVAKIEMSIVEPRPLALTTRVVQATIRDFRLGDRNRGVTTRPRLVSVTLVRSISEPPPTNRIFRVIGDEIKRGAVREGDAARGIHARFDDVKDESTAPIILYQ
jgi:hypothetical protein